MKILTPDNLIIITNQYSHIIMNMLETDNVIIITININMT